LTVDLFHKLENWYSSQCDGEWEHQFGIAIETLDNPGWEVTIDLDETKWCDLIYEKRIGIIEQSSWMWASISECKFQGSGDTSKLNEIITTFFEFIRV
jgi:hypothetical protein